MAEQSRERVGVYIDFDNIVISRYNQLHGKGAWAKDRVRGHDSANPQADQGVTARINQATIDVSAILDYASSFGSIVISRAYADWSAAVNARYQRQLNDRAVDLTQLFPTVLSLKNGADIRLAVDVVEDVFRLDDLTHIVIVAGDSDYIPLAQRCKRLGRYVVGIGVSGATSSSLAAACDEFADYDSLPGIASAAVDSAADGDEPPARSTRRRATKKTDAPAQDSEQVAAEPATEPSSAPRVGPRAQKAATSLLTRAMELLAKNDLEWQHASVVKSQMRRMDPSFQERTLGYSQFSDFLSSRDKAIELDQESPSNQLQVRLRS